MKKLNNFRYSFILITLVLIIPKSIVWAESHVSSATEELVEPHPDCNPTQTVAMQRAIDDAQAMARAAIRDLDSNNIAAIKRWFGKSKVDDDVREVYQDMLDENEYLRCGGVLCDEPSNLGVVDHLDHALWLDQGMAICPQWFQYPHIGLTSITRVETVVHELAHHVTRGVFGDQGITDWENPSCVNWKENFCYGYPNALGLASHCSRCALGNAVNYTGFAAEAFMRPAWLSAIF